MAKHKSKRALYELLAKQRGLEKAKADVAAGAHTPPERAAEVPPRTEPVPIRRTTAPAIVMQRTAIVIGGVRLTWPYLVIAGVVLVCLCYLCYALGARSRGDGLPATEKHPTMEEIQTGKPIPGLVGPGAKPPALGKKAPGGVKEPITAKTPPAPTGPQYRVRIARLDVSQPDAIDDLRAFLARDGVQTELVTRSGYHVLYSRQQFTDKTKADGLALQINKSLEAFEKETRRPTSKDAYTVQIKKE